MRACVCVCVCHGGGSRFTVWGYLLARQRVAACGPGIELGVALKVGGPGPHVGRPRQQTSCNGRHLAVPKGGPAGRQVGGWVGGSLGRCN